MVEKIKLMKRKIASELAIGVVLLIAFIVAGISWLDSLQASKQAEDAISLVQAPKKEEIQNKAEKKDVESENIEECKPRYYEGKDRVSVWIISEENDVIKMAIKKDEVSKLPVNAAQSSVDKDNFIVGLVDATEETKEKLKDSSPQKPATITLQGYAEVCLEPPLVSLEKATVAFKGRS